MMLFHLRLKKVGVKILERTAMLDGVMDRLLHVVQNHLYELVQRLKQVQMEVNVKAKNFLGFTFAIQKIIEAYMEPNFQSFRMEIANQIELIHYDYHIQSLKLEYLRHKPNAYQVCCF
jgi:hypothetical protein